MMGERARELLLLLIGDVVIFIVALYVTLTIRYVSLPNTDILLEHLGPFLVLSFVWLILFYVAGLYDKHTLFFKKRLVQTIVSTQVINIVLAAVLFFTLPFGITPKTNLVIYLIISVILITLWRVYVAPKLSVQKKVNALLLAEGEEAIELLREVNENNRYPFTFIRLIDSQTAKQTPDFSEKLLRSIRSDEVSVVVVDTHNSYVEEVLPVLFELSYLKFKIRYLDFHNFYESVFDRVALSALHHRWFVTNITQNKKPLYGLIKRGFDITVASFLGIFFLMLLPIIIIIMRLEGKGDIFITQERLGKNNKKIQVYKLRTMTENRSASSTWTNEDIKEGNVVTKVGAFLRKTSLDEVPQVINILKGEMSLIGPRNDITGLADRIASEVPFYAIRNSVIPGVTGWAQTHQYYGDKNISPQSIEETRLRFSYDLYYIKYRSIFLDIEITLRTIKTLLSRFGVKIRFFR